MKWFRFDLQPKAHIKDGHDNCIVIERETAEQALREVEECTKHYYNIIAINGRSFPFSVIAPDKIIHEQIRRLGEENE